MLTPDQQVKLAAYIAQDPALSQVIHTSDGADAIATEMNKTAVPDFWVYKTSLAERTVYEATSVDNTTWNWDTYMAQTVTERDAWGRIFTAGTINPSLPQTRSGVLTIFKGNTTAAIAQRAHISALSRELASTAEKLFAVPPGTGTSADPATMSFQGALTYPDVLSAWAI